MSRTNKIEMPRLGRVNLNSEMEDRFEVIGYLVYGTMSSNENGTVGDKIIIAQDNNPERVS